VANVPAVMVGPGTGVAPFMGFIEEKAHSMMHMYFGCKKDGDYIYRDVMEAAYKDGKIQQLNVAFSQQGQK